LRHSRGNWIGFAGENGGNNVNAPKRVIWDRERIAIEHGEVGNFASADRAEVIFFTEDPGGIDGYCA
jgi:hypothetical protein